MLADWTKVAKQNCKHGEESGSRAVHLLAEELQYCVLVLLRNFGPVICIRMGIQCGFDAGSYQLIEVKGEPRW